jgi:hypothetical protein
VGITRGWIALGFGDTISPKPILTTLLRADGVNIHGKIVQQTAVRGVIQRGQNLLMITGYHKLK